MGFEGADSEGDSVAVSVIRKFGTMGLSELRVNRGHYFRNQIFRVNRTTSGPGIAINSYGI